jgi:hypothetical protein
MWKYCEENKIEWTYSRPGVILGLTKDNALVEFPSKYWTSLSLFRPNVMGFLQNLIIPLAMYAAITKYMGEKILKFPGKLCPDVIVLVSTLINLTALFPRQSCRSRADPRSRIGHPQRHNDGVAMPGASGGKPDLPHDRRIRVLMAAVLGVVFTVLRTALGATVGRRRP